MKPKWVFWPGLVGAAALMLPNHALSQQSRLELHQRAMPFITDTANRLCDVVKTEGSAESAKAGAQIQAEVSGLLRRLVNIGATANASVDRSSYQGLRQSDLPTAVRDILQCRERVFNRLFASIFSAEQATSQAPGPSTDPAAPSWKAAPSAPSVSPPASMSACRPFPAEIIAVEPMDARMRQFVGPPTVPSLPRPVELRVGFGGEPLTPWPGFMLSSSPFGGRGLPIEYAVMVFTRDGVVYGGICTPGQTFEVSELPGRNLLFVVKSISPRGVVLTVQDRR